jgi:hypothetical protein
MGKVAKNILTILAALTFIYAGYYFYSASTEADGSATDVEFQQMLANTNVFIARSQELDQMNYDISVFENERFQTLRSFTNPVESQPVGRTDPFADESANSE